MLTQVSYDDLKRMLGGAVEIIREKNDELSLLDAAIGDGDHGVTMLRAFERLNEIVAANPNGQISPLLSDIAWALMDCDGGATGPLYGSLFLGMSEATEGLDSLDANAVAKMLEGGLASLEKQTKARVGDKTLMDALIPAVHALRASAGSNPDIAVMLDAAASAALQGAESTKNIPARFGRAKFQGERTLGHPDPGSVSMAYVFKGFKNGLGEG